jgi:penicillin-binding protein 1C
VGTVIARTAELPAALQRFRPGGLPQVASQARGDSPPAIAFPPDGARIELGSDPALSLKVHGGTPPFTWLADGVPIATQEFRRDTFWDAALKGFARLSVIDAKGQTATARVRVE